jgi:hypothetical protein
MRKLALPLIGLALAATAANAQETPDAGSLPGGPEAAAPADAVPPATPDDALPPADDALPPPDDAVPSEPAPPADAAPDASVADSGQFTDEQVDQFAAATVKVQEIDADTSIAAGDKQSEMAAAVTEAGLDPATYNKIGQAIAIDPELRSRVQVAMARHTGGGQPADPTDG